MDGQMRLAALVLGLVFLVGTATLVVSSNLFNYSPFSSPGDLASNLTPTDGTANSRQRTRPANRIKVASSAPGSSGSPSQLAHFEELLATKNKQLKQKDDQISALNAQLRQPRNGSSSPTPARGSSRTGPTREASAETSPNSSNPDLSEEIRRLNQVLLEADLQDADLRATISNLEKSLSQANEQLELLEEGANAELSNSAIRQRRRHQVMADLVARVGTESIPYLIPLLDQTDPQIRAWAAQLLGRFGEDGEPALDALRDLLDDDSSEDVRDAAADAIDSIRGR